MQEKQEFRIRLMYHFYNNEEIDTSLKNKLEDNETYIANSQHVWTNRGTVFGRTGEDADFRPINIARQIERVEFDDDGVPFLVVKLTERMYNLLNNIDDLIIIGNGRILRDPQTKKFVRIVRPNFTMYRYNEFIADEKRKMEENLNRRFNGNRSWKAKDEAKQAEYVPVQPAQEQVEDNDEAFATRFVAEFSQGFSM